MHVMYSRVCDIVRSELQNFQKISNQTLLLHKKEVILHSVCGYFPCRQYYYSIIIK